MGNGLRTNFCHAYIGTPICVVEGDQGHWNLCFHRPFHDWELAMGILLTR